MGKPRREHSSEWGGDLCVASLRGASCVCGSSCYAGSNEKKSIWLLGAPLVFCPHAWVPPCRCGSPPPLQAKKIAKGDPHHPPSIAYSTTVAGTLRKSDGTEATQAGQAVSKWYRMDGSTTAPLTLVGGTNPPQRVVWNGGITAVSCSGSWGSWQTSSVPLLSNATLENTTWFVTFAISRDATTRIPNIANDVSILVCGSMSVRTNNERLVLTLTGLPSGTTYDLGVNYGAAVAGPVTVAVRLRRDASLGLHYVACVVLSGTSPAVVSSETLITGGTVDYALSVSTPVQIGSTNLGLVLCDLRVFGSALSSNQMLTMYNALREAFVITPTAQAPVVEANVVFDATRGPQGDIVAAHYGRHPHTKGNRLPSGGHGTERCAFDPRTPTGASTADAPRPVAQENACIPTLVCCMHPCCPYRCRGGGMA